MYKNLSSLSSGGIVLSFDAYYSTWTEALSYFDKYDLHATWFCNGGSVSDFMTNAQNKGHTIGYYGKNHTMLLHSDYYKDGTYCPDIYDNFNWEKYHFLQTFLDGGIKMYTFAIPHGNNLVTDTQLEVLRSKYQIVRNFDVDFHLYTEAEIKSGFISSQSIDNCHLKNEVDFEGMVKNNLIIANLTDKIWSCTTHSFVDEVSDNDYAITWSRLSTSFLRFGGFDTLRCSITATLERASHATTIPNAKFVNKEFLYA